MIDTLGDRVHYARRKLGLTQTALAKRIGVGNVTISRIENGYVKQIQTETLIALAQALNVSTDWLLGLASDEDEEERLAAAR